LSEMPIYRIIQNSSKEYCRSILFFSQIKTDFTG